MHDRYLDFKELRLTGEASHIPDTKLDNEHDCNPRQPSEMPVLPLDLLPP